MMASVMGALALAAVALGLAGTAAAPACPVGSSSLRLDVDDSTTSATLSNPFVCVQLEPGRLASARADATGQGNYGS